jgi:hypothetical protein
MLPLIIIKQGFDAYINEGLLMFSQTTLLGKPVQM